MLVLVATNDMEWMYFCALVQQLYKGIKSEYLKISLTLQKPIYDAQAAAWKSVVLMYVITHQMVATACVRLLQNMWLWKETYHLSRNKTITKLSHSHQVDADGSSNKTDNRWLNLVLLLPDITFWEKK